MSLHFDAMYLAFCTPLNPLTRLNIGQENIFNFPHVLLHDQGHIFV